MPCWVRVARPYSPLAEERLYQHVSEWYAYQMQYSNVWKKNIRVQSARQSAVIIEGDAGSGPRKAADGRGLGARATMRGIRGADWAGVLAVRPFDDDCSER